MKKVSIFGDFSKEQWLSGKGDNCEGDLFPYEDKTSVHTLKYDTRYTEINFQVMIYPPNTKQRDKEFLMQSDFIFIFIPSFPFSDTGGKKEEKGKEKQSDKTKEKETEEKYLFDLWNQIYPFLSTGDRKIQLFLFFNQRARREERKWLLPYLCYTTLETFTLAWKSNFFERFAFYLERTFFNHI